MTNPEYGQAAAQAPQQPPLDDIMGRSSEIEHRVAELVSRLRTATDNINGAEPEEKNPTNMVPRGGAILNAILNSQDRINMQLNRLSIEIRRVEGLAMPKPTEGRANR